MVKKDCVIIVDSRESLPLEFPSREITTRVEALEVGDYAVRINGKLGKCVVERKSKADAFSSFSGDRYNREREKILRAKQLGYRYILALECSYTSVREGHRYQKGGEWIESGRNGLSLIRQFESMSEKYGIEVWYFNNRSEMASRIQECLTTPMRIDL